MPNKVSLPGLLMVCALVAGCASVPMADVALDTRAKTFAVSPGKANIYVYRDESLGAAARLDLALNGKPVGHTAAKTYIALHVPPGKHTLVSKAENNSTLDVVTEAGKNYFVWQEVKMGFLHARSELHLVDETTGKAGVTQCNLIESRY